MCNCYIVFFIFILIRGIILICVSSDHTAVVYTYDDILNLYNSTRFLIMGTIIASLLFIAIVILVTTRKTTKIPGLRLVSYSFLAGALGGCQFFTKTFVEIFKKYIII